ncbi:hypothetical protein SD71_01000 [Cohnella kolymensis]|uniref:Hydantoinase B/oxoprolinase domain-containing protein n=1 Tax=Cohnella kolymensis TaxID=1590652 RepID=A0ABR5A8B8_9BACL|nr:hypothetical protein [Cohnella kolymensis]KIL37304.1 hypothetical protein SD71_01000 [Cohnella kolymensis]
MPNRYADYPLKEGDVFRFETPGGGGYGDPLTREPQSVLRDVLEGYVSVERAESCYGVVIDRFEGKYRIHEMQTDEKRKEMRETNGDTAIAKS